MNAEIKKVNNRTSLKTKQPYTRVYLKSDNGEMLITDLVPTFRNYKNWVDKLEVGTVITNLTIIEGTKPRKIDADSLVEIVKEARPPESTQLDLI